MRAAEPASAGYTCAGFHPDGLILATGTPSGVVRVWDVKTSDCLKTLQPPLSASGVEESRMSASTRVANDGDSWEASDAGPTTEAAGRVGNDWMNRSLSDMVLAIH